MAVIGGNKRYAGLIGKLNESRVDPRLFRRGICLYLKIVIASAEKPVIPYGCLCRFLCLTRKDKRRHFTGNARGKTYQSFMPLLKEFLIYPRSSVETFGKTC